MTQQHKVLLCSVPLCFPVIAIALTMAFFPAAEGFVIPPAVLSLFPLPYLLAYVAATWTTSARQDLFNMTFVFTGLGSLIALVLLVLFGFPILGSFALVACLTTAAPVVVLTQMELIAPPPASRSTVTPPVARPSVAPPPVVVVIEEDPRVAALERWRDEQRAQIREELSEPTLVEAELDALEVEYRRRLSELLNPTP